MPHKMKITYAYVYLILQVSFERQYIISNQIRQLEDQRASVHESRPYLTLSVHMRERESEREKKTGIRSEGRGGEKRRPLQSPMVPSSWIFIFVVRSNHHHHVIYGIAMTGRSLSGAVGASVHGGAVWGLLSPSMSPAPPNHTQPHPATPQLGTHYQPLLSSLHPVSLLPILSPTASNSLPFLPSALPRPVQPRPALSPCTHHSSPFHLQIVPFLHLSFYPIIQRSTHLPFLSHFPSIPPSIS